MIYGCCVPELPSWPFPPVCPWVDGVMEVPFPSIGGWFPEAVMGTHRARQGGRPDGRLRISLERSAELCPAP